MISIYKTHTAKERYNDFQLFLNQCKNAMNKAFGYKVSVKYDTWSMYMDDQTFWEKLKNTGSLSYNDECLVIDFEYDRNIYIEIK